MSDFFEERADPGFEVRVVFGLVPPWPWVLWSVPVSISTVVVIIFIAFVGPEFFLELSVLFLTASAS
jgi:hypothetical protein